MSRPCYQSHNEHSRATTNGYLESFASAFLSLYVAFKQSASVDRKKPNRMQESQPRTSGRDVAGYSTRRFVCRLQTELCAGSACVRWSSGLQDPQGPDRKQGIFLSWLCTAPALWLWLMRWRCDASSHGSKMKQMCVSSGEPADSSWSPSRISFSSWFLLFMLSDLLMAGAFVAQLSDSDLPFRAMEGQVAPRSEPCTTSITARGNLWISLVLTELTFISLEILLRNNCLYIDDKNVHLNKELIEG